MASFSFLLSLALVTFMVDQSIAQNPSYNQRVTLYSGTDCTGSFLTLAEQYVNDLTSNGWNNFAYSARLTGVWNFYDLANFNANNNALMEYAFGQNQFCINFNNLRAKVTSLRFSGSPNDYRSNTLTLYRGTYFQDQEEYYINNQANVVLQQHASLVITGSSAWTLYDQPNFLGNAICVYPPDNRYTPALVFDLTSIDVPHNKIRSVAIGCYGKKIVRAPVATRGASLSLETDSLSASGSQ